MLRGAEVQVEGWLPHPKVHPAIAMQNWLRYAERRHADLGQRRRSVLRLSSKASEANHGFLISAHDRRLQHDRNQRRSIRPRPRLTVGRVHAGFPANKLRVATFNGTDGRRMEVPQTLAGRSPRVPTSSAHRDSERVANHSVKISREIVHRYQNSGPSAGTIGSHMYKRTGAKKS